MAVTFQFKPGRNALPAVHEACKVASRKGAEEILRRSQPLVPVDTGALRDSGRVTDDGPGAAVSYEGIAPDGYDYGVRQHEDLALHHPHGQAKFLEQPMHSAGDVILALSLEELRSVIGL